MLVRKPEPPEGRSGGVREGGQTGGVARRDTNPRHFVPSFPDAMEYTFGDPHAVDVGAVARVPGTGLERGLTSAEAQRRLAGAGRNERRSAPPVPAWRRVLAQLPDPLVYLLTAAMSINNSAQGSRIDRRSTSVIGVSR